LFHADRRTDMTKLFARNFANALNITFVLYGGYNRGKLQYEYFKTNILVLTSL